MKKQQHQTAKNYRKPPIVTRQFFAWPDNPWTPEQMAEALRRHPEQTIFWRSAYERREDTAIKMKYPNEDLSGNCAADWYAYIALVTVGQWEDFVIVETRCLRIKEIRSFLVVRSCHPKR